MSNPREAPFRDVVAGFPVPVDYETGKTLTENQTHHLVALAVAYEALQQAMHDAEGSTSPGEHQEHTWSSRRMSLAATHIETGMMFARKAVVRGG